MFRNARTKVCWLFLAVASVFGLAATAIPVEALPMYAARTKFTCVTCHFDPNGGGPRKDIGFLFARQRHDLTPDPNPRWQDLMQLTNNLGDVFYFGTNTRLIYLYNDPKEFNDTEGPTTSTFFQMQGALFTALRPHRNLVMVWNQDFNEFSGPRTRDLYGMIDGLPADLYIQAGQFRLPFGLRNDDHTGATRSGFLNAGSGSSGGILPFDARGVEAGIEVGGIPDPIFFAASLTNGAAAFVNEAQTVTGKFGVLPRPFQFAVSGYHSYRTSTSEKFVRWSGYGIYGWRDLSLIAEVAGGEDTDAGGDKTNKIAAYVEADYRFSRWFLATLKYDFIDHDTGRDGFAAERFHAEGTFTLVPFSDLRLAYRLIKPEMSGDENQFVGQFHFYY